MGLKYVASFDAVATTAQTDLFEINVPSDRSIIIHEVRISQSSDFGDAQAEILKLQFIKGYSTSGSGGSAPTPVHLQGSATASTAVEANNTTVASTGTAKTLLQASWNVALEFIYLPTPETRIELKASERMVVRLPAPADSLTLNGHIVFEEIGG